ncbi:MAG: ABC transporter ATP-binding protein [Gemmatimonadaceae bacterium]
MSTPALTDPIGTPRPAGAPALRIEHLSKSYGMTPVLTDVSLAVPSGGSVALVGESGAGKSTLLRCINRVDEFSAGRILLDGRDTMQMDPVLLRRRIGYVPQQGGLLPHWRVRRNAALVPWLSHMPDASVRADAALSLVGLDPRSYGERWPHELSGGQRQRVAVARALAGDQSLLLLDEPFGALDAITRFDLQRMLVHIRTERRVTTVLVTHDLREALLLADTIVVLRAGRVEQAAAGTDLVRAPATRYVAELLDRSGIP